MLEPAAAVHLVQPHLSHAHLCSLEHQKAAQQPCCSAFRPQEHQSQAFHQPPTSSNAPLSRLLERITQLRALAIEADPANQMLGPFLADALAANPDLEPHVRKFGWQSGAFTVTIDLHGLATAIQKYRYERLGQLGHGSYGVVYKARNRESGELYAIKKLKYCFSESGFPDSTLREISALRELRHPNIIELKDIISALNSSHVYLVLECLDCDLRHYLDTCVEASNMPQIKSFLYQIISAVHHAHSNLVMHRDLKPQNILVDKARGRVKLTDFGLARQYLPPYKAYTDKVVTLYYRAPELLLGCPHYSASVDLWSLGCIMAELLNFEPLFKADSEIGLLYKMFEVLGTPSPQEWAELSDMTNYNAEFPKWRAKELRAVVPRLSNDPEGLHLLQALLTYDPKRRITAWQALNHPWFAELRGGFGGHGGFSRKRPSSVVSESHATHISM